MRVLPPNVFGSLTHDQLHKNCVAVIRAMAAEIIAASEGSVKFFAKTSYAGVPDGDQVSEADLRSQAKLVALFSKLFPGFGMQAEENELTIEATLVTPNGPVVMTVDPLDGTNLYRELMEHRRISRYGVAVLLAIRIGTRVVATYVLDVFNDILFYVAPGATTVTKVFADRTTAQLPTLKPAKTFAAGKLQIYGPIYKHAGLVEWLGGWEAAGLAIPEVVSVSQSIALSLIEVADGGSTVGLARRPGGFHTPWDDPPMIAIGQALGIRTFWILPGGSLLEFEMESPTEKWARERGILHIPDIYVPELCEKGPVTLLSS